MTLSLLTAEEFQSFSESILDKSFMQSVEMARLFEKRGYTTYFLGLKIEQELKAAALLFLIPMTGGHRMEINAGPLSVDNKYLTDFYKELQVYAKEYGALELIVKPYDNYQIFDSNGTPLNQKQPELITTLTTIGFKHDGLQTGYPNGEPVWHYVKDLDGLTKNTLRKSFSNKGRSLANKTSTFGISVRKLKRDELHIFKNITSSTSERRHYTDKPLEYYQAFYDAFGDNCEFVIASLNFELYLKNLSFESENIENELSPLNRKISEGISSAKINKQKAEFEKQLSTLQVRIKEAQDMIDQYGNDEVVMAGSLFIYTPQEAVYLFSGSYTEFNRFYAPVVLQEHVMLEAIKRGIPTYNFLGITGHFDNSDGVLRFKQNFNGYIVRKMGTFRYYPKPLKYKAIKMIKKVLGRK